MADFKSLDEIFNDDFFVEYLEIKPKEKEKVQDPIIQNFLDVVEFYREKGREPEQKKLGKERTLFNKLAGIRKDPEHIKRVKHLDEFDLLDMPDDFELEKKSIKEVEEETIKYDLGDLDRNFDNLDDLLNDMSSSLGDDLDSQSELEKSLLNTKRYEAYKQKREQPKDYAVAKKMEDFSYYDNLFKLIHSEIASGTRQLRPIINKEENSADIKAGEFYIVNGQMLYVESVGDIELVKNKKGTTTKNAKMRVIYENGTYHEKLRRNSLAASFRRTQSYRVSEVIKERLELDEKKDLVTGYIYVLKSLSEDLDIKRIPNFYKIGVTKNSVEQRIANAKNEETYLYSDVKIIASWKVANISAEKLENTIHRTIEDYRVNIEIPMPNGRMHKPREWFSIEFDKVSDVITKIIFNLQLSVADLKK